MKSRFSLFAFRSTRFAICYSLFALNFRFMSSQTFSTVIPSAAEGSAVRSVPIIICYVESLGESKKANSEQRLSYSTQSAMKMFVSCGTLPFRFEAHTSRLPSDVNIGNASKSG